MLNPKKLSEIVQDIMDGLPEGLKAFPSECRQHLRSALTSAFEKLDLVTREEFDVQCRVLAKTREKLDAIEQKYHGWTDSTE